MNRVPADSWRDLGELTSSLAADSVLIQERLDAAAAESQQQFAALLARVPESQWEYLLPLLPARLVLTEHRVRCSLRVSFARTLSFSLVATPINLGYAALYGTSSAEESSLSVEVVATPGSVTPRSGT